MAMLSVDVNQDSSPSQIPSPGADQSARLTPTVNLDTFVKVNDVWSSQTHVILLPVAQELFVPSPSMAILSVAVNLVSSQNLIPSLDVAPSASLIPIVNKDSFARIPSAL